jgi:hypothetical protein
VICDEGKIPPPPSWLLPLILALYVVAALFDQQLLLR